MAKKLIEIESPQGKDKKATLFKLLFILVNSVTIAIILILEFRKGSIINFSDAMAMLGRNYTWLLLALLVFAIKYLADSFCYYVLIKDTTGESRFPLSMKIALIGKYGDGVTPMGTGGQPFQIYYLHKYNIELSKAASIPLSRVVVKVLGMNLTMLFFFIFFSQSGSVVVKTTAYVALFINSLLPFFVFFFAFQQSLALKLAKKILALGFKFKFIKDLEQAEKQWLKKVEDMLNSIRYFMTHPTLFLTVFFLSVLEILALATVPYLIYRAFGGDGSYTWLFMATSTMYVLSASIIAPTPGTSGVAEATFYAIFESVIINGLLFYAIISWRIITFYTFIIGGFILIIYESIYKKKVAVDERDERKGRMTNRKRKQMEIEAENKNMISAD